MKYVIYHEGKYFMYTLPNIGSPCFGSLKDAMKFPTIEDAQNKANLHELKDFAINEVGTY